DSSENQSELRHAIAKQKPILVLKADIGPHPASSLLLGNDFITTFDFTNEESRQDTILALMQALVGRLGALEEGDFLPLYSFDADTVPTFAAPIAPDSDRVLSLLEILSPVDLIDVQRVIESRRHPATRAWFLAGVYDWALDESAPYAYWLSGDAGSGKSVIAASICGDSRIPVAAFFFCKFDEMKRNDPHLLIPPNFSIPLDQLFQKIIVNPLNSRMSQSPLIICIDALDECAPENSPLRVEFLQLLSTSLHKLPSFVKLFVTSRPGIEFHSMFQDSASSILELSNTQNSNDTLLYTTSALELLRHKFTNPDVEIPETAETLCTLSNGLFVWLFFALEHLSHAPTTIPNTLLTLSSSNDLDSMYRTSLLRYHPPPTSASTLANFHLIAGTLITLKQPVGIHVLHTLTSLSLPETRETVSRISPLLKIFDQHVTFMHKSVSDFLTSPSRCGTGEASDFCINVHESELHLLSRCLTLILTDWHYTSLSTSERVAALSGSLPPPETSMTALEYALTHWMDHIECDGLISDPRITPLWHTFLTLHAETSLLASVKCGRGSIVQLLFTSTLTTSADKLLERAEATGYFPSTLLYESAKMGHLSVCQTLLTHTSTPATAKGWTRATAYEGITAGEQNRSVLHMAVLSNNLEIVKLVVEAGADVEEEFEREFESFMYLASGEVKRYLERVYLDTERVTGSDCG
ncbi:hypothetical protein HDU98_009153, partial [Podochytrium sp. JEL0797]